jgi:hypothetical protein
LIHFHEGDESTKSQQPYQLEQTQKLRCLGALSVFSATIRYQKIKGNRSHQINDKSTSKNIISSYLASPNNFNACLWMYKGYPHINYEINCKEYINNTPKDDICGFFKEWHLWERYFQRNRNTVPQSQQNDKEIPS